MNSEVVNLVSDGDDQGKAVNGENRKRKADAVDEEATPAPKASSKLDFEDELSQTGLSIFDPLEDLGYYTWDPSSALSKTDNNHQYKSLANILSVDEMLGGFLDLDGKPSRIDPIGDIKQKLPKAFEKISSKTVEMRYPFADTGIVAMHVASRRGLDLNGVDFCFGGSTLNFLSNRGKLKDESGREKDALFIAARVPGTQCIFVSNKSKSLPKDLSNIGYQFEQLATGGEMSACVSDIKTAEHIHTMKVGDKNVLFRAEVDAIDANDLPVEIKTRRSGDKFLKSTSVILQMISSGSLTLYKGQHVERQLLASKIRKKGYQLGGGGGKDAKQKVLTDVDSLSLSDVALEALAATVLSPQGDEEADVFKDEDGICILEENITEAMDAIQSQLTDDGVYKIRFVGEIGRLTLESTDDAALNPFPPTSVVRRLLE